MAKKIDRVVRLLCILSLLLVVVSCDDRLDTLSGGLIEPSVSVVAPSELSGMSVVSEEFEFRNVSSGRTTVFRSRGDITLSIGLYDVGYKATVTALEQGSTVTKNVEAFAQNVELTTSKKSLVLNAYVAQPNDDFIISEVFFAGTLRPTGNQYNGDDYIKIYNNTDHVLYADGLSIVESKFNTTQKYDYTPDIMSEAMTVQAIYTIPGDGTEHPVQPGEELLIADTGIDHRVANENSFDLSHADFEWYDVSSSPKNLDIDGATVPNLDKWYCYTLSFFTLHNRGFKAWALARMRTDKEDYVSNYSYSYDYEVVSSAGTFPMSQTAFRLPNAWIVDAVNCSVASDYAWNVTAASLDRGYSYCGTLSGDKTRYFHSVRRKMLYVKNGRAVLKDTNNSSDDFNAHVTPSEIERQGTATDLYGTPCTQLTWDGVQER